MNFFTLLIKPASAVREEKRREKGRRVEKKKQ